MNASLPDRQALRRLYDEAVIEIGERRPDINLAGDFYAKNGNSVFNSGYAALCDYASGTRIARVVPAAAGAGKTTLMLAFMMALVRYDERANRAPHGCVMAVDQIRRADDVFRELNELMPGKVAIWTVEHDPSRSVGGERKVSNPAAKFSKDDLRKYPIIVVTHAFCGGVQRDKVQKWSPGAGAQIDRALTVIDEWPDDIGIYELTLTQANTVKDQVRALLPAEISERVDNLLYCMAVGDRKCRPNQIYRYDGYRFLEWFATDEADRVVKQYMPSIPNLDQLFGFARTMVPGCTFASRSGSMVHFVGWESQNHGSAGNGAVRRHCGRGWHLGNLPFAASYGGAEGELCKPENYACAAAHKEEPQPVPQTGGQPDSLRRLDG